MPFWNVFFIKHTCINHKDTVQRRERLQVHSGRVRRTAVPPDYLHKGPCKKVQLQRSP